MLLVYTATSFHPIDRLVTCIIFSLYTTNDDDDTFFLSNIARKFWFCRKTKLFNGECSKYNTFKSRIYARDAFFNTRYNNIIITKKKKKKYTARTDLSLNCMPRRIDDIKPLLTKTKWEKEKNARTWTTARFNISASYLFLPASRLPQWWRRRSREDALVSTPSIDHKLISRELFFCDLPHVSTRYLRCWTTRRTRVTAGLCCCRERRGTARFAHYTTCIRCHRDADWCRSLGALAYTCARADSYSGFMRLLYFYPQQL